jgi:hypothetical protein
VLKDTQIRELGAMALGVEQIIAEPAEIEWCQVSSGEIMVLEAMPVGFFRTTERWRHSLATARLFDPRQYPRS